MSHHGAAGSTWMLYSDWHCPYPIWETGGQSWLGGSRLPLVKAGLAAGFPQVKKGPGMDPHGVSRDTDRRLRCHLPPGLLGGGP